MPHRVGLRLRRKPRAASVCGPCASRGCVSSEGAPSTKNASHVDRNSRRIAHDFAVLYNGHHDRPVRLTAIVQDVASSEIDDEVMRKAWNAEIIGDLYRLVEIAGRGREHLNNDDG